jgi:hypothetical protein
MQIHSGWMDDERAPIDHSLTTKGRKHAEALQIQGDGMQRPW